MKKRIASLLALMICASLLFCMIGCNTTPEATEEPTETSTEKPTEAPTEKPTEAPTEKPTDAPEQDEESDEDTSDDKTEDDSTTKDDTTTDDDTTTEDNTADAALQAELFLKMKEAYEATKEYAGDFTMNISYEGIESETRKGTDNGTASDKYTSTWYLSANKTLQQLIETYDEIYFSRSSSGASEFSKKESKNKYFTENSEHYEMSKLKETNADGSEEWDDGEILSDLSWQELMDSTTVHGALTEHFDEAFGAAFDAESYSELTAAYTKVLSEMTEAETKNLTKDNYTVTKPSAATYSIVLSEADGVISMRLTVSYEVAYEDGIEQTTETLTTDNTIFAKDGKITGIIASTLQTEQENSSELRSDCEYDCDYSLELTYEFDEALYNSVQFSTDITSARYAEEYLNHDISVSVNGYAPMEIGFYKNISEVEDFGEFFKALLDEEIVLDSEAAGYDYAWYTDAYYTAPLDFGSITKAEDILAIEELYLKITVNEGYAAIMEIYEHGKNVPEEYLTVFGPYAGGSSSERMYLTVVEIYEGRPNTWEIRKYDYDFEIITSVNDAKIDDSRFNNNVYTFTYEDGRFYTVRQQSNTTVRNYYLTLFAFDF